MFRAYREVLTSLLASAMLTSTLFPAPGDITQAGAVDPSAARRAIETVLVHAPDAALQGTFLMPSAAVTVIPVRADGAAAQTAAPSPAITREKMDKIVAYALTGTADYTAPEAVSTGLGLKHPFLYRSAGVNIGDVRHAFLIGVSDPARVIFFKREPGITYAYACDRDAKLLSAGTVVNGVFTPVDLKAAKIGADAEARFWAAEVIPDVPAVAAKAGS